MFLVVQLHKKDPLFGVWWEWGYNNSLSAVPLRQGLKQHWRTKLKSNAWELHWHPRMLGNAIQTLERLIVRIILSVKEKGKLFLYNHKLLPDTFFFFFSEQVITKMEHRRWHYFNRIILFSLKCRISGHSPKSETWLSFLSTHLLPICYICEIIASPQFYCAGG